MCRGKVRIVTIQALAWAMDQSLPDKPKLVLMALANHADHTNGFVHFDAGTIAREVSIREPSLWRYLGALERNGYLAKDQRKTAEGDKREYWLALDRDATVPWAWAAHDVEHAEDADPPLEASTQPIQSAAPGGFDKSKQAAQRHINAETARKPDDPFAIIEGSRAFIAWCNYLRERRLPTPYVRSMIVQGKEVRGFPMPSLFPPASEESAA